MKRSFSILLIISFVFSGCATFHSSQYSDIFYPQTDSKTVKIYSSFPYKPFIRLGEISATGTLLSRWSSLKKRLKKETAQMGGYAIVLSNPAMMREFEESSENSLSKFFLVPTFKKSLNGIAIRFSEED